MNFKYFFLVLYLMMPASFSEVNCPAALVNYNVIRENIVNLYLSGKISLEESFYCNGKLGDVSYATCPLTVNFCSSVVNGKNLNKLFSKPSSDMIFLFKKSTHRFSENKDGTKTLAWWKQVLFHSPVKVFLYSPDQWKVFFEEVQKQKGCDLLFQFMAHYMHRTSVTKEMDLEACYKNPKYLVIEPYSWF